MAPNTKTKLAQKPVLFFNSKGMFFADQLSLFDPPTEPSALEPSTSLETAVAVWIDYLRRKDTSRHTLQAFTLDHKLLVEYFAEHQKMIELHRQYLKFLDLR